MSRNSGKSCCIICDLNLTIYTAEGKPKKVRECDLWLESPDRVDLWGRVRDPASTDRIVTDASGHKALNVFEAPAWTYVPESSQPMFTEFVEYLIPSEESRVFFYCWLASKAASMTFRGPAILMAAERQGLGRTTLADIIRILFGTSI